jgi:hypothetical protein
MLTLAQIEREVVNVFWYRRQMGRHGFEDVSKATGNRMNRLINAHGTGFAA